MARWRERSCPKSLHPLRLRVQKVQFFKQQVGVECSHHLWLSPTLKLHSFLSKTIMYRLPKSPKILGQKSKSNHWCDANDSQMKYDSLSFLIVSDIIFVGYWCFSGPLASTCHPSSWCRSVLTVPWPCCIRSTSSWPIREVASCSFWPGFSVASPVLLK